MNEYKNMFRFFVIIVILFLIPIYGFSIKNSQQFKSLFFENTEKILIPDINDGYGVAFRDINNDGLPDIYLVCFRGLNRLLINPGKNQPFLDATIESGLGGNLMPLKVFNLELGSAVADFDNDNDADVIISGWGNTTSYFRNDGELPFKNVSENLNLHLPKDFNSAISGDVNNDGNLDVFLTDEHYTNRLLLNKGNGTFNDVTRTSGLDFVSISQGAAFCDLDNDGDLDLYVTNWNDHDLLYRNTGYTIFENINSTIDVCTTDLNTNGVSFGDIDNDGDFDMLVTNRDGRNYLYLNHTVSGDSNWIFTDATFESGLTDTSTSYGSVIADFNNDGWQDIFITNIGANQFYLNLGNGIFEKIFEENYPRANKQKGYSTGVACADYDLDGDLDLFVANKDTFCVLYTNPQNDSSYIKFKVHGIMSNRDAIGTRVEIYERGHLGEAEYLLGIREISGGSGYLSMNELIVHFGLDTISYVDAKFIFSTHKIVTMTALSAGSQYDVYEYTPLLSKIILSYRHLLYLFQQWIFWYQFILSIIFITITFVFIRLGLKRYQWNPATATAYVAGFFLLALILFAALKQFGFLTILLAIDSLTVVFMMIFIIASERIRKLYLSRKKYRTVLIDLSNQLVKIHDDSKLINTVISNITEHTRYDRCEMLIWKGQLKKVTKMANEKFVLNLEKFNQSDSLSHLVDKLQNNSFIERKHNKDFESLFSLLKAEVIFSIRHANELYGLFSVGSEKEIVELSTEDIAVFSSLANQIAITLENNEYIRQSNEMIKKLTESRVREKYLKELEKTNTILDAKNQELQKLYEELQNTQAQLIQSEKMSSLGQLVAGISHELNNPIGFIYSNSNQLKKYIQEIETYILNPPPGKNVKNILTDIKNLIDDTLSGSNIVKELVDNLRRFSHLDQAKLQKFDIHSGIESSLKILNSQLKNRIQVHKSYRSHTLVECNPGQINQVLMNIISNAAQAIEQTGNIWIETKEDNGYFVIEIRDDGKGISRENVSKIFDPFFTTKDVGEGTGLGLSISYSIIKNHKGTIEVESDLNKGSMFRIKLPITKGE